MNTMVFILDKFSFEKYHSATAKIGRILFKRKFSLMGLTSIMDFTCLFRGRVRPEYVLQPNVSLYHITSKEAIFVETPAGMNILCSNVSSFVYLSQFINATKIIKMSINDFACLAEKIGDPTVPVLWMSSTGRCGGTMVCKMFETVPGMIAIHEPDAPSHVYHLHANNKIRMSEYEAILKSMIRIMCNPRPGVTRVLIKPRPLCTFMIEDIYKVCPGVRHIFIYRNSLDTMRSLLAVMAHEPYLVVLRTCTDAVWFSNIFPYFRYVLRFYFTSNRKDAQGMPVEIKTICMAATSWASHILYARERMVLEQITFSLKYEDILSRPKEVIMQIFERLGIDIIHTDRAVASLSRDSQRGSPLSRENIGDSSLRFMSETDRINCDAILTKRSLPRMSEDITL